MNIKIVLVSLVALLLMWCKVGVAEQSGWNIRMDQSGVSFGQDAAEDPGVNPYAKPEDTEDPDYTGTEYESMQQPHQNTQATDWRDPSQLNPQSDPSSSHMQQNQGDMNRLNPQPDPPSQSGGSKNPSFKINFGN